MPDLRQAQARSYNPSAQAMNLTTDIQVFNNAERIVEGWYWAMRSVEVKRGRAKALSFFGKELVVYRGEDDRVVALDAYCPHMGAHLAEGKVEGRDIRCLFHYWKYDREGRCIEIPCQRDSSFVPPVRSWPIEERYGLVWIWAGSIPRASLPFVPELENHDVEFRLANRFTKRCHPNVMMINAIDAQHFNSVHNLPVELKLEPAIINDNCIIFRNTTKIRPASLLTRFISRFYKDALTYVLCYWFGSTGTVTIGPDFLHFHIIFALRPTRDGKSEGQTILVTRKRKGIFGKAFSRVLLLLTRIVGAYFARGDTLIFETIKFDFRTPIKADSSIIRFIEHVENQRTTSWELPVESGDEQKANNNKSHFDI
jgi:phenylpropionate dioxygenase-like ring-hydroxylating dioxygenase large terminal subunit